MAAAFRTSGAVSTQTSRVGGPEHAQALDGGVGGDAVLESGDDERRHGISGGNVGTSA